MVTKVGARERRLFNITIKSARIGMPEAQYEVGLMYANGVGVEQDFEQALHWIRQAAERGLSAAQYLLATRYAAGAGIERDDYKAVCWFFKAADQGHGKALFRLGKTFGAARAEVSHAFLLKAAELKLPEAQHALGAL